jgi:hypothetical protein
VADFIDGVLEKPIAARRASSAVWRIASVRNTKERPGYQIAESTVRQYVRLRKQVLGLRVGPPLVFYQTGGVARVNGHDSRPPQPFLNAYAPVSATVNRQNGSTRASSDDWG